MKHEEKLKDIEKLKKQFPDNEEFVKNNNTYHRFVVQKVECPKDLGKRYLTIMYDDNENPFVVLNILKGLTKEEKEKRTKEVKQRRQRRKEKRTTLKRGIDDAERSIIENTSKGNFSVLAEISEKLVGLKKEYKELFGREYKK